jgi:pantoate--beta-alanine ligase
LKTEPRANLQGMDTVSADTLDYLHGPLVEPLAIMLSVQFSDILLIDLLSRAYGCNR